MSGSLGERGDGVGGSGKEEAEGVDGDAAVGIVLGISVDSSRRPAATVGPSHITAADPHTRGVGFAPWTAALASTAVARATDLTAAMAPPRLLNSQRRSASNRRSTRSCRGK